ncbi:MAG: UvrD-helicase domain-containing protein [Actinobacteria bacterium]|nr:UvrD-helicase domain-containing protein [Actinomycetota bacterium]
MMAEGFKPTDSQKKAIGRLDGRLFIAAGAGSGKTAVVANRYVEAIASGKAEVDQILTITFTKKAAAEMMKRVRKVLRQRMHEDPDPERAERMRRAYRNIESSRISTNDSFYAQVLQANALAAGIDPRFTVADESSAGVMREAAFDEALQEFVERNGAAGTDFVMAYDPKLWGSLFGIIDGVYTTIRSRGHKPRLPLPDPEGLYVQRSRRLLKAIDDFDDEVKRTGASYATIGSVQETNWKLRAACSSTQMDVRRQMLDEGKPCAARGALKEEIKEIQQARSACLTALDSFKAVDTLRLMSDLLETYHRIYSRKKSDEGVMDFADLALKTRDLLVENKSISHRLSSSFEMIMVDEYQDTNPLQARITDLINTGNLMMVGDENQSIFGFRDAEVGLFQEEDRQAEAGGYRIPLAENFRSQPEILKFVDAIFQREEMLGRRYLQLEPKASLDPRPEECRIEVLVVDQKPPCREKALSASDARAVEAQLIAERLQQLHGEGYSFGDMAIIMANRTEVDLYSDALDRANINNYLAIGVKYFGRPELGDSINILRLLVNQLDDEALVAALRSPMVKVSDDTLYWLRQAAGRDSERNPNPLWLAVRRLNEPGLLVNITGSERGKLSSFAADLTRLRDYAARHSLQETASRVIAYNDYAAATAAGPGGRQALANLMKLLDLAADFEAAWGRDLAAFTEFLGRQKSSDAREADAPVEEEGVDSVRIMTMHSAKGLEFPLVVLPKLGSQKNYGPKGKPAVLLDREEDSGRVGLRFAEPGQDDKTAVFDYDELEDEKAARELEEEKRLIYVAMTRAERHLILVGFADLEKPGKGTGEGSRPFDWIRDRLDLDRKSRPGLDELTQLEDIADARVCLQVCTDPDVVLARAAETESEHELAEAPEPVNPAIRDMPGPAIFVPPVISPTSLDAFNACPRRYYFDKVLGIGRLLDIDAGGGAAVDGGNLNHMEMGSLVHHLLEHELEAAIDGSVTPVMMDVAAVALFSSAGAADAAAGSETAASDAAPKTLVTADYQRAAALLASFARTPVARTILAAHDASLLKKELPFQTLVGQTMVQGFIDALCPDDDSGTLVVDYKTGNPGEGKAALDRAAAAYKYQMTSYALAASRLYPGPVRTVLVFLGGDEPSESTQQYSQAEGARLEGEIKALIDSMAPGDFPPAGELDPHQCHYCAAGPSGARICLPPTGAAE